MGLKLIRYCKADALHWYGKLSQGNGNGNEGLEQVISLVDT